MPDKHTHVCSVTLAGGLDNRFRRWFQNPRKILSPYVREGMTAIDYGCGPGFFTLDMAALVGESGHVIAADIQRGMLDIVAEKLRKNGLEKRVTPHLCTPDAKIAEKADFVLLFYMVHEVPDKAALFADLASILKPDGRILVVEPPFHVSKKDFAAELDTAAAAGLKVLAHPYAGRFNKTALLQV